MGKGMLRLTPELLVRRLFGLSPEDCRITFASFNEMNDTLHVELEGRAVPDSDELTVREALDDKGIAA